MFKNNVNHHVAVSIGWLFAALLVGTAVRLLALRTADVETRNKRLASLRTWWILSVVLAAACLVGTPGVAALLCIASVLAIWEMGRMVSSDEEDRCGVWLAMLATVGYYILLVVGVATTRLLTFSWCVALALAVAYLLKGKTKGYVRASAGLAWGFMILVFGLSHAALLTRLPETANPVGGSVGWFLYLVILTESNDIFQALIGRRFGKDRRHPIAPRVSPNKTWEGFVGGTVMTIVLACALVPWLTPLADVPLRWGEQSWHIPWLWGTVTGLIVSIPGFFGDINMSAVKRDAGVKDSSQLLSGMGGVIDRIDSLTFAAPAFYYMIVALSSLEEIS